MNQQLLQQALALIENAIEVLTTGDANSPQTGQAALLSRIDSAVGVNRQAANIIVGLVQQEMAEANRLLAGAPPMGVQQISGRAPVQSLAPAIVALPQMQATPGLLETPRGLAALIYALAQSANVPALQDARNAFERAEKFFAEFELQGRFEAQGQRPPPTTKI